MHLTVLSRHMLCVSQAIEQVDSAAQVKLLRKYKMPAVQYKGVDGEQGCVESDCACDHVDGSNCAGVMRSQALATARSQPSTLPPVLSICCMCVFAGLLPLWCAQQGRVMWWMDDCGHSMSQHVRQVLLPPSQQVQRTQRLTGTQPHPRLPTGAATAGAASALAPSQSSQHLARARLVMPRCV